MTESIDHDPVDAVITWVDGTDPRHKAKRRDYLRKIGQQPSAAADARFKEVGEFEFCIASLLRFAPWLRRIHIITDDQEPAFMATIRQSSVADKVQIVDHQVVFRDMADCLPTFNNRSLLTVMWRIPDLADRFVYLNDDFVLLQPVALTDFFQGDRPVVRGQWSVQPQARWYNRLLRRLGLRKAGHRPGNREAQARAASLVGYGDQYFRVAHNPHPLFRPTLEAWAQTNPETFARNASFRLRSGKQFLADALATHLQHQSGDIVVDNQLRTARLRLADMSRWGASVRFWRAQSDPRTAFACLQGLESAEPEVQQLTLVWLDFIIGPMTQFQDGPGPDGQE